MKHPAFPAVTAAIRQFRGDDFNIDSAQPCSGGCSSTSLVIAQGKERYFLKLAPASRSAGFEAEIDGLLALAATDCIRVPRPLASGISQGEQKYAFLVLEHLELQPLRSADDGIRLADALLAVHRQQGTQFGWWRDNCIGNSPQPNVLADNWALFFADYRLRPQFERAREHGFSRELDREGARLLPRIPALFLDYRPPASLLHGDLWHGNTALLADGTPVLFDPAIHHGDRESDLAMSELFGGFPHSFYARYRSGWSLDEGYESRKPLYSLYHILNHLNLFGRSYLREALRLSSRLNEALSRRRE